MPISNMNNVNLSGKRVLIRQDLNVPIKQGSVSSDARIQASLPTLRRALEQGAGVMVMSHLGRPVEGGSEEENAEYSLAPVAKRLSELLACDVPLLKNWLEGVDVAPGEIVLLENVRFNTGEKKNDDSLAKKMAALCDVFVMDAFGTAHRAQASTHGVAQFAPQACAGPLLSGELDALGRALDKPSRPMLAIVGGSKVSTKLTVLETLADKVDQLIVGGGIANTFLAAAGYNVGKSLYEHELLDQARELMKKTDIPLPEDVVVGKEFSADAIAEIKAIADVSEDDMIFDIGPKAAAHLAGIIEGAETIIWNGPVGVFEFDQFGAGTKAISEAIASSSAFSIAGGGDTLAAVDKYGIQNQVSYISTGGGAFLEFVEGKELPAVAALKNC